MLAQVNDSLTNSFQSTASATIFIEFLSYVLKCFFIYINLSVKLKLERFLKLNNKLIPENITIQTWFSFLLQHGVRPYKYNTLSSNHNINGVLLVNKKSGEKTYIDQETGERVSVCITDSKTGKKQVVYWSEKEDVGTCNQVPTSLTD